MKVTTTAQLNHLRMSPQKVRLVTGLIKGMDAQKAIAQLMFSKKHAARPIKKLLESAIANAKHNHEISKETLTVENVVVNQGPVLHRWMPRAQGRATPLRKRSSHVILTLSGVQENKKEIKKEIKKTDEKKELKRVKKDNKK
ncbi:MAG: 50S ribosomal protein L22 [Candidatus Magasanikbacteria bacterium]